MGLQKKNVCRPYCVKGNDLSSVHAAVCGATHGPAEYVLTMLCKGMMD